MPNSLYMYVLAKVIFMFSPRLVNSKIMLDWDHKYFVTTWELLFIFYKINGAKMTDTK